MNNATDMPKTQANEFVSDIKKLFTDKKIWFSVTEINEPDLKFIKIEASIKVK